MAFQQPLEADLVEDIGFVSVFLRAPVIGTIMWMLGSNKGKDSDMMIDAALGPMRNEDEDEHYEQGREDVTDDDDDDDDSVIDRCMTEGRGLTPPTALPSGSNDDRQVTTVNLKRQPTQLCSLKQQHSDYLSGLMKMDSGGSKQLPPLKSKPRFIMGSSLGHMETPEQEQQMNDMILAMETTFPLRGKKMSWSDESGQSLVEYMDETSSSSSSSFTTMSTAAKSGSTQSSLSSTSGPLSTQLPQHFSQQHSIPRKSAMKRSKASLDSASSQKRYLPKGLTSSAHNGLILPTRPFGGSSHHHHSSASGASGSAMDTTSSPEFGWYVNLTPPTPEMYSSIKQQPSSLLGKASPPTTGTTANTRRSLLSNTVNSQRGATVAWPSVPL